MFTEIETRGQIETKRGSHILKCPGRETPNKGI